MKITSQRQIYILFAIVAFLVSFLILALIKNSVTPYKFVVDKAHPIGDTKEYIVYHDYDKDGKSEGFHFGSAQTYNRVNYHITAQTHSGAFIDQFNFFSMTIPSWITFADFNNDNFDDLFVFSQLKDSLFISIVNIKTKKFYVQRQKILTKPDSAKRNFWDIQVVPGGLINFPRKDKKEFIFSVTAGFSLFPRTVYSYDIKKKKIIKKFETKAKLTDRILIKDLNDDGKPEIMFIASSTGNMPDSSGYHDYTNWVFMLNTDLKPVFPPKHFGSYPSMVGIAWVNSVLNNTLYFFYTKKKENNSTGIIYSINYQGRVKQIKEFDNRLHTLSIINSKNNIKFFLSTSKGQLFHLDKEGNIVNKISFDNALKGGAFLFPINFMKFESYILFAINKVLLFNKNLELLADFRFPGRRLFPASSVKNHLRLNGKGNAPQIAVYTSKNNYLLHIEKSKIYALSFEIFGVSTFLLFFMFVGIHKLNTYLSTYIKYFGYSLQKAQHGIIILNYTGKIFFINENAKRYLKLNGVTPKKDSYKEVFSKLPRVLKLVSKAIETKSTANGDISFTTLNHQFKGEMSITPFTSFMGFTYAYLLEISDYTQPLLTDRGKVWTSTVQRIAHEIKTPLSTIGLNIKTLQLRLDKENVSDKEKYENDIMLIRSEVARIRDLVNSFLKFTNLNKPKFQIVNVNEIISIALKQFTSYTSRGIKIEWNLDDECRNIWADEHQVIQMLQLIIENAIDAMNGKGTIIISSECLNNGHTDDFINGSEHLSFVVIKIKDNGPGIEPEILSRIFEPYFTTKKDGTGMGLALAKKIAEDHRGTIEVESSVGNGTIVKIYLRGSKEIEEQNKFNNYQ